MTSSETRGPRDLFTDAVLFILMSGCAVWVVHAGAVHSGYNWQWYRIPRYLGTIHGEGFVSGPLLRGLAVTVEVSLASLALSSLFGLAAALGRLSGSLSLRALSRIYLELIRNTPLLVQLFFIYFVISPVVGFGRFASAVLALSLFEGAYASEIIRAGILAVPRQQWEASLSLGMSRFQTYVNVVLPQALTHMVPPLAGQMISLVKDSALVSTIALYDLTMEGQMIMAETYMVFELWFTIAGIYLVLTLALSAATRILERRLAAGRAPGGRPG
jgi:polar amino acid transport system permease protein